MKTVEFVEYGTRAEGASERSVTKYVADVPDEFAERVEAAPDKGVVRKGPHAVAYAAGELLPQLIMGNKSFLKNLDSEYAGKLRLVGTERIYEDQGVPEENEISTPRIPERFFRLPDQEVAVPKSDDDLAFFAPEAALESPAPDPPFYAPEPPKPVDAVAPTEPLPDPTPVVAAPKEDQLMGLRDKMVAATESLRARLASLEQEADRDVTLDKK